jgi:hypothetical protein
MAKMDSTTREPALLSLRELHPQTAVALSVCRKSKPREAGPIRQSSTVLSGYRKPGAKAKRQLFDWMKRCPRDSNVIEFRQLFPMLKCSGGHPGDD